MVNWFCAAPNCTISLRKKKNVAKYPGLRDVTFHAFPTEKHRRLRQQWISMMRRKDDWSPNNYSRVCSRHFPGNKGPTNEFPVPVLFDYNNWKQPITVRSTGVITKLSQHRDRQDRSESADKDVCDIPITEVDMVVDDLYNGVGYEIQLGSDDTPSKMYSAVKCADVCESPSSEHDYICVVGDTTVKANLSGVSRTRVMPMSGGTHKRHAVPCEDNKYSMGVPKHCKMTVTCDRETQTDLTGEQIIDMSEAASIFLTKMYYDGSCSLRNHSLSDVTSEAERESLYSYNKSEQI
ncbi:uncharacterized protein [Ptychodera flava]|uniref:uncharacterized protein n=1 Tax=Ptychodera flava TaxID=63121 RepID=UPI00396A6554